MYKGPVDPTTFTAYTEYNRVRSVALEVPGTDIEHGVFACISNTCIVQYCLVYSERE